MKAKSINMVNGRSLISRARFASPRGLAAGVESYDPITGQMDWNSGDIPSGTPLKIGYAFVFEDAFIGGVVEGVEVIWGSVVDISAPSPGMAQAHSIKSYAWGVDEPRTLDAFCFIAEGPLDRLVADWNAGERVVALRYDQFLALGAWDTKIFQEVLTVHPEMPTGFTIDIINPPAEATHWRVGFNRNAPDHLFWHEYNDSNWLEFDKKWHFPDDPEGYYLWVRVGNVPEQIMLMDIGRDDDILGPVYDGKQYRFDCATESLYEI